MASFNKVILVGNLTRDPEIRTTPSGSKVSELGLAVSENWRSKSGETRETVCFVDVIVWDRLAELCQQYLVKGRPILVDGRLQMDEWTNDKGERRTKLRVRANSVKFLGPPPQRDEGAGAGTQARSPAPAVQGAPQQAAVHEAGGGNIADDLTSDDEQLPF